MCGIYEIYNKVNNKRYIGRSIDIKYRWRQHKTQLRHGKHKNRHLQKAWDKYGEDNFVFNVIEECDRDSLNEKEIYYISKYNTTKSEFGYNWTGGGDGPIESNEIIHEKRVAALKRRKFEYPDLYKKLGEQIKQSFIDNPEKREIARQKTIEQFKNPECYKKYREQRASKEFKDKISKAHKGRKIPEERKLRISKTLGKPVMCVETGEIFYSGLAAARSLPGNQNINQVVDTNKTACGYHWVHVPKDVV